MNASVNPNSRERLAADQRANEPSMEEILASIRRSISDGDAVPVAQSRGVEKSAESILPMPRVQEPQKHSELPNRRDEPLLRREDTIIPIITPRQTVNEPVKANFSDFFEHSAPVLRGTDQSDNPALRPEPETGLLSQEANKAISSSFAALSTIQSAMDKSSMDDMVTQLLRPMLKSWLDHNLPALVEKLVRAEIERVARGSK